MSRFTEWQYPKIIEGQDTKYGWRVSHVHKFIMGDRVDIGYGCFLMAAEGISIGTGAQLGSHCSVYSVNTIDDTRGPVIIKRGAKIGSHTVIFPGVTIGKDAIVGAHSLVKTDVPDGETWFGVPAKRYEKWGKYVSRQECLSSGGLWVDRSGDSLSVPRITCGCQES